MTTILTQRGIKRVAAVLVAAALGVHFDGFQEVKEQIAYYQFTDIHDTGSTFGAPTLEDAPRKFRELRQRYGNVEKVK